MYNILYINICTEYITLYSILYWHETHLDQKSSIGCWDEVSATNMEGHPVTCKQVNSSPSSVHYLYILQL